MILSYFSLEFFTNQVHMLLIIISWGYMFLTLVNFGFVAKSIFPFKRINKLIHLALGFILMMILSHIWAFYDGFGLVFHTFLLVVNGLLFYLFKEKFFSFYTDIWRSFKGFEFKTKLLFVLIFLLILTKSASQGSMLDNETYYIQTINWLNTYGFVKGLANLHLFLGQQSAWHVMQSVFSFHFLHMDFNDLGSFILLILNGFAFQQLNSNKASASIFAFLPVLNFFLLEFCVVPSPDFGIVWFSLLIFYLFLKSYKHPQVSYFYLVLLMFLTAMLIKITAIALVVFPLVLFFRLKSKSLCFYFHSFLVIIGFASLWIAKNLIASGYPFFPSSLFSDLFDYTHQIPEALHALSLSKEKLLEFFVTPQQLQALSNRKLFLEWLSYSKISLIFNSTIILSILAIPILFIKLRIKSATWWIYVSFLVQLMFLAFSSPQYRFVIHYLVVFTLVVLSSSKFIRQHKLVLISWSQVLVLVLILFPVSGSQFTLKDYELLSKKFQLQNLWKPAPNSSIKSEYEFKSIGNLNYFSPSDSVYFWSTGDCNLPCVNSEQLEVITKQIQYRPQLLDSTDVSKGFYSETISID